MLRCDDDDDTYFVLDQHAFYFFSSFFFFCLLNKPFCLQDLCAKTRSKTLLISHNISLLSLHSLLKSFLRPCILSVQQLHIHYQQPNNCAKARSKVLLISHNISLISLPSLLKSLPFCLRC
jgi:hypothetical protein